MLNVKNSASAPEIVIVASAFGAQSVRRLGHAAWLDTVADAGAAGFEVRRELFSHEAEASCEALHTLGAAVAARGMWAVYSTPAGLYRDDGTLDAPALAGAYAEADALGARWVKLQLGTFAEQADAATIVRVGAGRRARLVVENGQHEQDGKIARFVALFAALEREGASGALGMTFDTGNWHWSGQAPLDAAAALAPHVEYVHCKSSEGLGARRFPVAPAPDDSLFRSVLDILPRTAPRGIEFPLDERAPAEDARRKVAWLAAA
ncbi:TIM barrel protein [Trinickia dinghuensis]|uniref:Sugar phosphate isomerase/epimerase n=1 Tax=Trinickia dinghuensis TaxID=2291023 RepID=A0A3D8JQY8_9BURK|nr:TIM barrel protein [Trinickia dinghuensis]RDU95202.1 sugar phosphate isomerase/epimerase [Trinickia dinghuensis]